MASINKVMLIGNLGKDPEVQYLGASNTKVARFSLATSESFKKDDQWENKTEWHNIICFGKTADRAEKLSKGENVYIEGKIQTSSWEKEGEKKYKTEIIANTIMALTKKEAETHNNDDDSPF